MIKQCIEVTKAAQSLDGETSRRTNLIRKENSGGCTATTRTTTRNSVIVDFVIIAVTITASISNIITVIIESITIITIITIMNLFCANAIYVVAIITGATTAVMHSVTIVALLL